MKTASTALLTSLNRDNSIRAVPKLIAEWNLNRYYNVVADNTPSEDSDGFDIEMFPVESLYMPNRPTKGINKARINEGSVSAGYVNDRKARFYIADYDDIYKYWTSPYPSDATTGAMTNCQPFVVYGTRDAAGAYTYQTVDANKIVVKFENSWATPSAFTIEARVGSAWTTVFTQTNVTDTTWERTGELILYYNGTNWRQNNPAAPTSLKTISGVRVTVNALKGGVQEDGSTTTYRDTTDPSIIVSTTGKDAHCNVIEISARREVDISADVISVNDTFDMGDTSNLYPIGTLTTNTGSVTLWNGENNYSNDNPLSPYQNLLESNVKLTLSYVYNVGTGTETIQQFVMYSGTWAAQKSDSVEVDVADFSKFFQQIIPRPAMWEGLTVPEIVFRLCDSIGFNKYLIVPNNDVTNFVIPVFWVDGEKNMWEILDELAHASQSAIYFDATGTLMVKTREAAFNQTAAPNYTLRGTTIGADIANIATVDQTTEFEANKVKISYQTTRWSDYNNGQPVLQQVWTPDGTVALRSTPLRKNLGTTDTMLYINPADVRYWPYKAKVNIGGETISYDGLEFAYYTYVGTVGTRNLVTVKSAEEQAKYHAMTPAAYQLRNALTGGMAITERGMWNSTNEAHSVAPRTYSVRRVTGGTRLTSAPGMKHYPSTSTLQLTTNKAYNSEKDLLMATIGGPSDTGFFHYGTRLKFVPTAGMSHQHAGIMIHNSGDSSEDGYYIGLTISSRMNGAMRKKRNELMVYSRTNGKMKPIGGTGDHGAVVAVAPNRSYEMDVQFKPIGNTHQLKVWINGKLCITSNITGSDRHISNGRFGLYAAGRTKVNFEYLYALRRLESTEPLDDFSFLDKKEGGFVGKLWDEEWVYRMRTRTRVVKKKSTKVAYRNNEKFFDEFGPWVHEIREFDVKFDPTPVLHSRLFFTNDWTAAVLEYAGTPFGAKFTMANTARINAILNGEDSLTFSSSESSVEQVLTVFGRPLVIDEAVEKEFQNTLQIQRRGEIVSEINSPWIQNEEMATAVGTWIVDNMSYGNDQLQVEIFGNPLIEVSDVVQVFYPRRNLTGQKYFVTGTTNTFEQGLTTTLTLRRANN